MVGDTVLCVISTFTAWIFALLFIRKKGIELWLDGALCAIMHGVFFFVSTHSSYSVLSHEIFLFGIQLLCFLLMAVVVQLQSQNSHKNAWIAFGLSQSVYSSFSFIGYYAIRFWKYGGFFGYLVCICVFFILTYLIRGRFPKENWKEYYLGENTVPERMNIKVWHIYFVVIFGCSSLTAILWLVRELEPFAFLSVGFGICALLWGEIVLLIVMQAYKQERIEILLDRKYREEMQSFMNVIRSQRHDYNFHVQTIGGLLREGNLEECLKYMDALEKDSATMNSVLPIKDPAISATIHNFYTLSSREGIPLYIDIQNDLTQISTNVYETNKIISNLLQNAIDETKTHTDKSYGIHLSILKRGEYIIIRVSNEADSLRMNQEEMENFYRQGYSTKQGHEGVGLSSIRQLAGCYRGTVYTKLEGNVVHFVAKIPINFTKGQESRV